MKGENIKRIRATKGLTQTKLAAILKVDRTYINQIENGKVKPSIGLLERIAKELECSMKDFF